VIREYLIAAATAGLFGAQCTVVVLANPLPTTWSGLVELKGQNVKAVYLLPWADFRVYKSVMLDPTEADFAKGPSVK
jgi:hypothetical protein